MTNTVNVDLGHRSYDILIGDNLLSSTGDLIKSHLTAPRVAVVTDQNVYDLHGQSLETALSSYKTHMIVLPAGEKQKSFDGLQTVLNSLFEAEFDRNDTCLLYTSPSPRDRQKSRMPSSA